MCIWIWVSQVCMIATYQEQTHGLCCHFPPFRHSWDHQMMEQEFLHSPLVFAGVFLLVQSVHTYREKEWGAHGIITAYRNKTAQLYLLFQESKVSPKRQSIQQFVAHHGKLLQIAIGCRSPALTYSRTMNRRRIRVKSSLAWFHNAHTCLFLLLMSVLMMAWTNWTRENCWPLQYMMKRNSVESRVFGKARVHAYLP